MRKHSGEVAISEIDKSLGNMSLLDNAKEITSGESLDNHDLSEDTKNGSQGLSEETDEWNLWSLFPLIKLSELPPDEQAERVNLFLFGFASIFLMNVMPILIKVSVTFSEYEDQLEIKTYTFQRQMKGRCN